MDTVLWLDRSQYTADNSATADYNEVRIYSHPLSPTEIYISHTNGPDNLIIPPPQASNLAITTNNNLAMLVLSWTPGPGSAGSVAVMSAGQAPSGQPTNGVTYSGNAKFGNGQNLGNSNYVVFGGSGSTVTVSNLTPGVRYYAAVYSYTGSGGSRIYNLADAPLANRIAPGTPQSISLQVPAQMVIYGSGQATVTADFGGGITTDVTTLANYTSSATNVVTVSSNGLLQAVGYGSALITASYQGKLDSNSVSVVSPLTNNLAHRYNFEIDASDLVGTAHGALLGGATISGGNVVLNGTGAYVALPADILSNYTALSIEAWVTDNGSGTWARIFDFGSGTTRNMFMAYSGATTMRTAFTTNGSAAEQRINSGRPAAGAQTHFVLTTDGATQMGKVYTNGVLAASNVAFSLRPVDIGATPNDYIGRSEYAVDPYFSGSIDEFRIYNVALPASIILTNFQDGPDGLPLPPPVAVNDSMILNPGAMALIPVLQNDQGALIDSNSVTIVTGPTAGTAQVQTGGKVLYTHNGGPAASDQFTYRIQNRLGATSDVATVSLIISQALRLPNTTMTIPNTAPPVGYQASDAFPGLTVTQALALRTPPMPVYSNLLFFVERRGFISYVNVTSTTLVRQVFMNISDQVSFDNTAEGEMGLESMDFHPGFATNGYFYVTYIATGGNPYRERLARFTANPVNLTVDTNTQTILFDTTKREFNHNGGDLHFGNDGYLYVSMGDEGNQYNFHTNAQRLDLALFSGILRLDVDKKPGSLEPKPPSTGNTVVLTIPTDGSGHAYYSIPPDNPFLGVTSLYGAPVDTNHLRAEFYAIGFRHPWRFSIDPQTGEIWVGHVGQDTYEAVDLLVAGGNYGWPYYEASHLTVPLYGGGSTHPGLSNPPPGFVVSPAIWEYPHSAVAGADPNFSGLDVIGGVVYHGSAIPQLTNAYVFGDFDVGGNVWALHRSNSTVTVERLTGQFGIGAYGIDPHNGDVLLANYIQNKIQRLVRVDVSSSTFPQKLSDTGIFADLATLTPNPGIVNYEPIIAFWSDYANKRRWFTIPDLTNTVAFVADGNWAFPTGMKWIKHFDLETQRGNPATKKRIETRVLVKTDANGYGVSYQWNDAQTEAYLAPDGGTNFVVTVQDGTNTIQQQLEIPSRAACLACHTPVGGFALSFNTRELNQATNMNGFAGNQLSLLSQAGYFASPVENVYTLPGFAAATNTNYSLEYRVRSYLSENCVQCHQPGGPGAQTADARPWLTMGQTHLVNGPLDNDGVDPPNELIVAGDTNHSVLLRRIEAYGFSRMPPLATHQLDPGAISLLTQWITTDLTNRQDFSQWQAAWFGSTNNPLAAANADPDNDGANNYYEFLTGTSPVTNTPLWKISLTAVPTNVSVNFLRLANRGFLVETSSNLFSWAPWDAPGNQVWFSATAFQDSISGPPAGTPRFFRVKIFEP